MKRFASRHILVTGAGTGIGMAIALRLASEGATLSLLGRRIDRLQEAALRVNQSGGLASAFVADVRDQASVDRAVDAAAQAHGPFFGAVANAGVGGPNQPGAEDRFLDLVQTNLAGTYFTLRAVQRHLAPGPQARHLVAISSILGRFGVPGYTGYCASKTGVIGLVRALSLELAAQNVQVNAICPGWVETDMAWEGIDGMAQGMGITREQAHAQAMSAVPLGRMSKPEDIAGLVAFLMSEDARGITGQGMDMNGGAWMG